MDQKGLKLTMSGRVEGDKVIYKVTATYPKGTQIVFTPSMMQTYLDRLLIEGMIDKHGRG